MDYAQLWSDLMKPTLAEMKKGIRKKLGRIPLPRKRSGPQSTKKGKKGYNRKLQKKRRNRELW
ncbi:MAG: hypothetical protein A2038_05665 [Deltaproteobacteria bacterium GWA2_57_13]|nr:MAG: hypothetical protein A2038_05665 [Deltaproteobacteria bacterium GWA2_57_13]OGQ52487.1 MAG: hypothetical protein A3I10_01690 [Deltaproteobacteria bacterium RIFCSPLOWO2_02_FULL_57_26]OGQ84323.1 MAG: hypothetical protein A3G40_09520 [Deltaproteobacteria bacterium RIFCSPLOWO2_12_FULL_57_22]